MSRTLVDHARDELDRIGEEPGFAASLVATVGAFASWGHSGSTPEDAVDLLVRLLRGEPLTELTVDPGEWEDRSDMSGTPMWQNVRDSKAISVDRGVTYTRVGPDYGTALEHSALPPAWTDRMVALGFDRAEAEEALWLYVRGGQLDDTDRQSLDAMTDPGQRERYMAQRWGGRAAQAAQMLYEPPGTAVDL